MAPKYANEVGETLVKVFMGREAEDGARRTGDGRVPSSCRWPFVEPENGQNLRPGNLLAWEMGDPCNGHTQSC
jgi:hypothetical protein